MPELPEVETVKESLKLRLNNKKIIRTRVLWDNIIAYPSKEKFIKETANQSINDVKRRGKFLLFDLDDYYLLSHLRMEGKYFFKTKDDDIAEEEDENKDTSTQANDKSVNVQQLPATEETRAAFVPEKGHLLVDCDYGDQEGHVFTELSNDKEWIAFYNDPNQRDGHSFVAKMCFPKDLDGVAEKDVKKVRKDLRDLAKKARFCFNYNGQAPTMATNCNIPVDFATEIYNNYFKRFNGIASYFKVQKRDMWNRGYILISKITGLRAYIYDYPILKGIERRKNGMEDFWDIYKAARDSGRVISEIPPSVMQEIAKKFAQGVPIEEIAVRYSYKVKKAGKVEERFIDINRETVYVSVMKHLWKRKSASDNQSCNYPLIVGAYSSDAI